MAHGDAESLRPGIRNSELERTGAPLEIALWWLPSMVTNPTPVTWLNFCASTVSARSLTFSRGNVSEVICRVRIGVSAGLTLL